MSKAELTILVSIFALSAAAANAEDGHRRVPKLPDRAIIRQAPGVEALLSDSAQRVILLKGGAASAKAVFALETATQAGAAIVGGPARLAVPYVAEGATKAAHVGKTLVTGHGSDVKYIELDALPGTTAATSLRTGNVEILVPLNEYIPSADAVMDDIRPVLLRLTSMKDQVRLLAARQIELRSQKRGRFHVRSPIERIEVEVEENVVPASFERLADNVYRIWTQPLTVGEYALVFRMKAATGRYTTNVALRSAIRAASSGPDIPSPTSTLTDLINPSKKPNPARESQATSFIAFDFRLLP
jgi:hypothetical protein